ncbi:MAG: helix-turn-helix domain-containing protein, partial [Pseudomonadota bacterium]
MEQDRPTALRGFDSYELRLGDELRGHRATLGKSLLDVQRELRIKASFIDGIENGDPSVVPNPGFVPGYVRAYARYLGLDPESVYRRFCEENGFVGQTSRMAQTGTSPKGGLALGAGALGASAGRDPSLSASHFASPVGRARPVGLGVAPSDIASALVLVALIGGLGWGGWALVKDIQRVEFAPVNETPELLAAAPAGGALPTLAPTAEPAPWIAAGPDRQAALEELYSPGFDDAPAPTTDFGDGPIAAIDPDTSGLFSRSAFSPPTREAAPRIAGSVPAAPSGPGLGQAAAPPRFAATPPTGGAPSAGAPAAPLPAGAPQPRPILSASTDPTQVAPLAAAPSPAASLAAGAAPGLFVVAQERAWMRVTAADGTVLMERILEEGETWQAPGRGAGLRLR